MSGTVEFLKNQKNFRCLGPIEIEKLEEVEAKMNLKFSEDYKEYVLACGIASLAGHELTGICTSDRLHVEKVTEEIRKSYVHVSKDLYVLEEAGIDGIIIWQDGEGIVYRTVYDEKPEKIADSIVDYFRLFN